MHTAGKVADSVESTVNSGRASIKAAAEDVQTRLGLAPPEATPNDKEKKHKPSARTSGTPRTPRSSPNPQHSAGSPKSAEPAPPSAPRAESAPTAPPARLEPGPPISLSDDGILPPETPIYSSHDRDVVPPRLLKAQVSTPLFIGLSSAPNEIELVVSVAGAVESAHLRSSVRRLTDVQLLSSAKSWEFAPATREGAPVRYRVIVSWESTP